MSDGYFQWNTSLFPTGLPITEPISAQNDPVGYTLSQFIRAIIDNYVSPSFAAEAAKVNFTSQGYPLSAGAVGTVVNYPLNPALLLSAGYTFPILSLYREDEKYHQFTLVRMFTRSEFCLHYVLPPLDAKQYNRLYSFLSLISKTFVHFLFQGFDPLYLNGRAVFREIEVHSFSLTGAKYSPIVAATDKQQLFFPSLYIRFSALEPQYFQPLLGAVPQNDGYGAFGINVFNVNSSTPASSIDIADGYAFPSITLSSITPSVGSSTGGTVCILQGTGLTDLTTVTICGVPQANITLSSNTRAVVLTTQTLTPGIGDVTVSNSRGDTATLSNAYTYT